MWSNRCQLYSNVLPFLALFQLFYRMHISHSQQSVIGIFLPSLEQSLHKFYQTVQDLIWWPDCVDCYDILVLIAFPVAVFQHSLCLYVQHWDLSSHPMVTTHAQTLLRSGAFRFNHNILECLSPFRNSAFSLVPVWYFSLWFLTLSSVNISHQLGNQLLPRKFCNKAFCLTIFHSDFSARQAR